MSNIKNDEGFTLIELMVVIAILGIIVGIAVPRYSAIRDRAYIATGQTALRTISNIMEMYYLEHGEYPALGQDGGEDSNGDNPTELNTYIANLGDVLGDWTIITSDQTFGSESSYQVVIEHEEGIILTLDDGNIIEPE